MSMSNAYRWLMVAAGALITCMALGAEFSLAVYLQPMSEATGWSRAGISGTMTFDFLAMGFSAFGWGSLSDRIGLRPVALCGAVLIGAGQLIAAQAQSLLAFQLCYGLVVGIGTGAIYAPLIAASASWFEHRRGLAVSLVSAGMGVAPMTISPIVRWLVTYHDWRWTMTAVALAAWAVMIPAALVLRRADAAANDAPSAGMRERASLSGALRSFPFLVFAGTFFLCCGAHAGPIFHTMSYALACGIAPMSAVSIYSLEGLAGLAGRLLFGLMADRFGVKRILVGGLFLQAVVIGLYVHARQLEEFYVLAAVLGMAYGGVMPLYAALARDYFPASVMGGVMGAAAMVSSLAMALGPLIGGWVFDRYGDYGWLYAGSCAVGLGAVAISLAFPPVATTGEPQVA
jgi:MFS family permease